MCAKRRGKPAKIDDIKVRKKWRINPRTRVKDSDKKYKRSRVKNEKDIENGIA